MVDLAVAKRDLRVEVWFAPIWVALLAFGVYAATRPMPYSESSLWGDLGADWVVPLLAHALCLVLIVVAAVRAMGPTLILLMVSGAAGWFWMISMVDPADYSCGAGGCGDLPDQGGSMLTWFFALVAITALIDLLASVRQRERC